MNGSKSLILAEMVILVGGQVVIHLNQGRTYTDIVVYDIGRPALAAALVGAILLTLDEVGYGGAATAFGGLMVLGYLLSAGGALGPAALNAVNSTFRVGGVSGSGGSEENNPASSQPDPVSTFGR